MRAEGKGMEWNGSGSYALVLAVLNPRISQLDIMPFRVSMDFSCCDV